MGVAVAQGRRTRSTSLYVLPMLLWLLSVIPAMEPGGPHSARLRRTASVMSAPADHVGSGTVDPGPNGAGPRPALTIAPAVESPPNKAFRPLTAAAPRSWLGVFSSPRPLEWVGNDPVARLHPALRKRRSFIAVDDAPRFARIQILCRLTC